MLTTDECREIGGHCYQDDNKRSSVVIDTMPSIYHRSCRHCGHVQEGEAQPRMRWWDDDAANKSRVRKRP